MMKFNMNNYIYVTLNRKGMDIFLEKYKGYDSVAKSKIISSDGLNETVVKMQMCEFIPMFKEEFHISNSELPFSMTIEIPTC